MNSAPSNRYNTASDPITAISETALEMGCRCTTTLMAATTAMPANTRKRINSIRFDSRKHGDRQAGGQQVQHGDRKQNLPGEAHPIGPPPQCLRIRERESIPFALTHENTAIARPVASRFNMATGNRTFQAKPIS